MLSKFLADLLTVRLTFGVLDLALWFMACFAFGALVVLRRGR